MRVWIKLVNIHSVRLQVAYEVLQDMCLATKLAHRFKIEPLYKSSSQVDHVVISFHHPKEGLAPKSLSEDGTHRECTVTSKDLLQSFRRAQLCTDPRHLMTSLKTSELSKKDGQMVSHVTINSRTFTSIVLADVLSKCGLHGIQSGYHEWASDDTGGMFKMSAGPIVVDFSSPNIAKPFHAGHLRSTVIGNFIGNIHAALGHSVTRINYYGDWGTQFALLSLGYQRYGDQAKLSQDPIAHLYEVYVKINADLVKDDLITKEVNRLCSELENPASAASADWRLFREMSLANYTAVYQRLGVRFDANEWESQFHKPAQELCQRLLTEKKVSQSSDGAIHIQLEGGAGKSVALIKSNGSSLYSSRDLAAAIHRYQTYGFDKLYYVTEQGQSDHFSNLKAIIRQLGYAWADTLIHVPFGRLSGISTRRGSAVFLEDILNEAKDRMLLKLKSTPTTQSQGAELDEVAEKLATCAVIIHDLKFTRLRNSKFNWEEALCFDGDTGPFLQLTHARLCSLQKNCGLMLNTNCSLAKLTEPEALRLIIHLARFDEAVGHSYRTMEASVVARYLFDLCHFTNAAVKRLRVKDEDVSAAEGRLLLFHCAQLSLAAGLKLFSIQPLHSI